jgi:hypothetical protein
MLSKAEERCYHRGMKAIPWLFLSLAAVLAFPRICPAQVAVPTTPKKFDIKPITGSTATAGATVNPSSTAPSVRQTTYLTLSPLRQWSSSDGKTLMGKLIAWEETTTTTAAKAPADAAAITTRPTIVRGDKVRLLIDHKAFEIPLARLGAGEQEFIQKLQTYLKEAAKRP